MKKLYLVPAAQYINGEMQAEFGAIIPAFLPVAQGTLLAAQVKNLSALPGYRVISIPQHYQLHNWQQQLLDNLGFDIVYVDVDLSLTESLLAVLEQCDNDIKQLYIQYGDTIISEIDLSKSDVFSYHRPLTDSVWAGTDEATEQFIENMQLMTKDFEQKQRPLAISGYFSFSDIDLLKESLRIGQTHFADALNHYHQQRPLQAMTTGQWFDFGHMLSFYQSRKSFFNQREFNHLSCVENIVTKSSHDHFKMQAEANWYQHVPSIIKQYLPNFIQVLVSIDGVVLGYEFEYLSLLSLAELFVFTEIPLPQWQEILLACGEFLQHCRKHTDATNINTEDFYRKKTLKRIEKYCSTMQIDQQSQWQLNQQSIPAINEIIDACMDIINLAPERKTTVMHGDFCFANIMYDYRNHQIKTYDPRGYTPAGEITIYGDDYYDLAKLYHSVIGGYDLIIAGHFHLEKGADDYHWQFSLNFTEKQFAIQRLFVEWLEINFSAPIQVLHAMTILLFLSMLSLHTDNPQRQQAFLLNAMRLYITLGEIV